MDTLSNPPETIPPPAAGRKAGSGVLRIALQWALATSLGWLLALEFAAIPWISGYTYFNPMYGIRDLGELMAGPVFYVTGGYLVLVFMAMGFLSSVPQVWLWRKWGKNPLLWLAMSTFDAAIGGGLCALIEARYHYWVEYPFYTLIPVSVIHCAAFVTYFDRAEWGAGCLYTFLRSLFLAVICIFLGFFASPLAGETDVNVAAIIFAMFVGFPFGFLNGTVIAAIFKVRKPKSMPLQKGVSTLPGS